MFMLKKKISFALSVMMLVGATSAFAGTPSTGDPFHAPPSLTDGESISADECENCGISVEGGHCDGSCNVILDRVELPVSEGEAEAVEVSDDARDAGKSQSRETKPTPNVRHGHHHNGHERDCHEK